MVLRFYVLRSVFSIGGLYYKYQLNLLYNIPLSIQHFYGIAKSCLEKGIAFEQYTNTGNEFQTDKINDVLSIVMIYLRMVSLAFNYAEG